MDAGVLTVAFEERSTDVCGLDLPALERLAEARITRELTEGERERYL